MSAYIAIDVGGTQIRVAVYPEHGTQPLRQHKIRTHGRTGTALERLNGLITELWPADETVKKIGIAAPGPVDPREGVVFAAPNIPGWDQLPLSRLLEERFHVPVSLGNDANLATMGEWTYGAGRGHHDMIYMTISTGIGGGVISDDHLVLGSRGLATELGHVTILPDGPICSCGLRGHLESISSGPSIARYVAEQIALGQPSSLPTDPPPSARDVSMAAAQGDALCIAAIQRAGHYLGLALANYVHIFNPTIIVLGGGVSQTGELLFAPLRKTMHENILSQAYLSNLTLTTAALGDDTGLLGALALARSL